MTDIAVPVDEHMEQVERHRRITDIVWFLLPLLLAVFGYWVVRDVDAHGSGALGLIEVMPILYFVAAGLLGISFVLHVRSTKASSWVLSAHIFSLILLLHGIVSWIEGSPRFTTAYTHLGFIDYIQQQDKTLPALDARMSWPGFFAMGAMLNDIAGIKSAMTFLLWAPLFFNLLFAPLVWSLTRGLTTDRCIPWIATYLFFGVSWVGQDYFAPQAVNILLFLAFVNILFRYFRAEGPGPAFMRPISHAAKAMAGKVLRVTEVKQNQTPLLPTSPAQRVILTLILVGLYSAMIVSHQLTPIFLLVDVLALVVMRSIALRGLPLLMTVGVFTWISYAAFEYWRGHIGDLFGGFGQVGGTVDQNVNNRVNAVETIHVWVIYIRLGLSALLWGSAIVGIIRRIRAGHFDLPLIICFFCPFLILAGQSYGGEAILRVFAFALPFAVILAVLALFPRETQMKWGKTAVALLIAVAIAPTFMVTRFGNEQFEYISPQENQGVTKLFELANPDSTFVALDYSAPFLVKDRDTRNFISSLKDNEVDNPDVIYQRMTQYPSDKPLLLITRSQTQAISVRTGRAENWADGLTKQLEDSGKYTLLYENPDARIYTLSQPTTPAVK